MTETLELSTGEFFDYTDPKWDIDFIAHSLSMLCRFGGQCKIFYSVAEHSVLVSHIMLEFNLGDPMEGLLHDAAESVLMDLPRPVKRILPEYMQLSNRLERSMRLHFHLPEEETAGCKKADTLALLIEARQLMISGGEDWNYPPSVHAEADGLAKRFAIFGRAPDIAEIVFKRQFDILLKMK